MSTDQPIKSTISHAELKKKAMQTFFFGDDDLPFNRDGKLSDKQKHRFMTTTSVGAIVFIVAGLVLSALFVWSLDRPMTPSLWAFPILGMAAFTAIGIYVYWLGGKVYKSGIVKSVIGIATFRNQVGNIFCKSVMSIFGHRETFEKYFYPIFSIRCIMLQAITPLSQLKLSNKEKRPTKRAPDAGDSGAIPSLSLRLSIFPVGRRPAARPSAGNANRSAASPNIIIRRRKYENNHK